MREADPRQGGGSYLCSSRLLRAVYDSRTRPKSSAALPRVDGRFRAGVFVPLHQ